MTCSKQKTIPCTILPKRPSTMSLMLFAPGLIGLCLAAWEWLGAENGPLATAYASRQANTVAKKRVPWKPNPNTSRDTVV